MAGPQGRRCENLRRYFKPSPNAMRQLTSLLGPGTDRRHWAIPLTCGDVMFVVFRASPEAATSPEPHLGKPCAAACSN